MLAINIYQPTMTEVKSVAVVTISDAAKLSPAGRKELGNWLRRVGAHLVKDGAKYSPRFTARYTPAGKKTKKTK